MIIRNNKTPTVTITFPTYNGWEDTKECLESLSKLNYAKRSIEIIVVDNNSQDQTPQKIRKLFSHVKVIEQQKNLGYAKAVNISLSKASGQYILFTNNDIVLDRNYIKNMVSLAMSNPEISVIGSMVYLKNPKGKIGFNGLRLNPYLGYHQYDLKNLDQVRECDLPPSGGFFVRRSLIDEIGSLDEGFFLYFEDVDFCLRAKRAGYKIIFNSNAIAYHGQSKTAFRQNFHDIVSQGYKSKWRCIFKNATLVQIISSIVSQFTLFIIIENLKSNPKTYSDLFVAFLWNLKNLKATLASRRDLYG